MLLLAAHGRGLASPQIERRAVEQPHLQRVVMVKASGPPFETPELHEAAELTLDAADAVADQELADRAFELVSRVPFVYEERRSQTDWGASGSVL